MIFATNHHLRVLLVTTATAVSVGLGIDLFSTAISTVHACEHVLRASTNA